MSLTLNVVVGGSYFFSSHCSVGAWIKDKFIVLIDSGIDSSVAAKLDKIIQEKNLILAAIINTHHHADHCGGNNYFQKKYPYLKIFASIWESLFIENPKLGPICFSSGGAVFKDMRSKFLEPEPSIVTDKISVEDQVIEIIDEKFTIVGLPGHTPGMIGVINPDNVFYCGDAFFGDETFNKYGLLFYTNIQETLVSLKKIQSLPVELCVFYHGGLLKEIKAIAEKHVFKILETSEFIFDFIRARSNVTIEQIIAEVMKSHKITDNMMQLALTRTCIQAYLSYLESLKRIKVEIKNGLLSVNMV